MGEASKIEWTDHSFNPWWGCARVSPGCEHCYAEAFANRTGNKVWGVQAPRRFFGDQHWREPLKWNRAAAERGTRARVFCASMADVFEDRDDLLPHRARLFRLIDDTPELDWLLLTKRPQNVMRLVPEDWRDGFPLSVWLGTTAEDQQRAAERVPVLRRCPAFVHFVSMEPLLGHVTLDERWLEWLPCGPDENDETRLLPPIRWVIAGGESGARARHCDVQWIRSIVEQCKAAGTACFVKQLGATIRVPDGEPIGDVQAGWTPYARTCISDDNLIRLTDRKGGDMDEWPFDLRVRQFPGAA